MNVRIPAATLALALAPLTGIGACREAMPAVDASLREIPAPGLPGSGEPNLSASGGSIYLSWLEPTSENTHALRFAVWEGRGWSDAHTIAEGQDFFVNWADFPSLIALPDGRLAAHWLVRSGPTPYAYDVYIAQSHDGGLSWSEGVVPHRDGTPTEHGFVSLFPWADGQLAAIWLDGRNFVGAEGEVEHGTGADMTLRHTTLDPAGRLGPERVLDDRVCECCQTSVALTTHGPVAVYRDRSPAEVRDIAIVRYLDGRWTEPRPIHRDGWHLEGCPVNGPAAAAQGDQLAVAWFTAAEGDPRVLLAFSTDAGASFAAPLRLDGGDPLGRVDLLLLDDGDALVTWLERTDDGAEIRLRRVGRGGELHAPTVVSVTSAARASGFPRLARAGEEVVLAWTEAGDPSRIRTASLRAR
jgi:hypothetical protein